MFAGPTTRDLVYLVLVGNSYGNEKMKEVIWNESIRYEKIVFHPITKQTCSVTVI